VPLALIISGAVMLVVGVALILPAAGVAFLGVLLIVAGVDLTRRAEPTPPPS
jgi:hypothetical protein